MSRVRPSFGLTWGSLRPSRPRLASKRGTRTWGTRLRSHMMQPVLRPSRLLCHQPRFIQQRHRSPPPARLRFQTETQVSPRNPGTYDLLDAARVASDTRQVSLTPPSEGWSVTPSTPCEAWNDFDPPRYRAETSSQPQAHFGRICDRLISAAISPKRAIPNPVFSR